MSGPLTASEQGPPHGLYLQANQRMASGDLKGAEDYFMRALALDPAHGAARANLGYLKEMQGELAEAEIHYLQAIALMPEHAQLYQNLSVLLLKGRRFDESEAAARKALQLAPTSPAAWTQLGALLACVQREAEAEAHHRRALALDPHHARSRFNLSYLLLRQGRFPEGWEMLDARWEFDRLPLAFDFPQWDGEPLAGKSIIICVEAGHGDSMHFIRYAPMVKALGAARVAVVCQPALVRLFTALEGVDAVYALDQPAPPVDWDYWTRPMRLPGLFGTDIDSIPAAVPYLGPSPELAEHWHAALTPAGADGGPCLRVGLAWKGNPHYENDGDRSLPSLQTLAPLAAAARGATALHFVSLQKGPGEDEAAHPPAAMTLQALGPKLRDFADTAAVIAQLDLVISVDTAVAHLAGAMGKPCWLLLPDYCCDWRWLAEGDDTPWYPTMRLFRQRPGGGWAGVVAQVAGALGDYAEIRR